MKALGNLDEEDFESSNEKLSRTNLTIKGI